MSRQVIYFNGYPCTLMLEKSLPAQQPRKGKR
jgi:hypothetical protein